MRVEGHEVAESQHVRDKDGLTARPYRFETGRNPAMARAKIFGSHRRATVPTSRKIIPRIQRGRRA